MEIRIHTQSGSIESFYQDDATQAARILKGIHPAKVFAGNIITIAGDYSISTFETSKVSRVDLVTEDVVAWKHPGDIVDVSELTEEEFREQSHLNDPARLEPRRIPKHTGEFAVVFVDVEMTGATRIFLCAKIRVGLPAERLQLLGTLFSAGAVHFRNRQGGVAILNLKNLIRFTFNPGPERAPSDAWPAHHLVGGGTRRPAYNLD